MLYLERGMPGNGPSTIHILTEQSPCRLLRKDQTLRALRVDLEKFAAQTAGRIRGVTPVPHDQLWKVLARAHVGVVPLADEEKFRVGSPIKLFEYMAAGLPILATRIVCHTDVAGNGEYAFWAEQADVPGLLAALRLVWQNQDSLSKMGSQVATAAQAWTWHESAKKLKVSLEYGLASAA